jgi:hypothetical protein
MSTAGDPNVIVELLPGSPEAGLASIDPKELLDIPLAQSSHL